MDLWIPASGFYSERRDLHVSVCPHVCENFVGVAPNVALFCHFFIPRIEGDALSGSITWIPRTGSKQIYLEGLLHLKWDEWRANWCWIKEKDFPDYCAPRTERVLRGKDWSDVSTCDGKLTIALDASPASGLPA